MPNIKDREEEPYYKTDHYHCWQEKKPPCGQRIEHLKCCLCEEPNPKIKSLLKEQSLPECTNCGISLNSQHGPCTNKSKRHVFEEQSALNLGRAFKANGSCGGGVSGNNGPVISDGTEHCEVKLGEDDKCLVCEKNHKEQSGLKEAGDRLVNTVEKGLKTIKTLGEQSKECSNCKDEKIKLDIEGKCIECKKQWDVMFQTVKAPSVSEEEIVIKELDYMKGKKDEARAVSEDWEKEFDERMPKLICNIVLEVTDGGYQMKERDLLTYNDEPVGEYENLKKYVKSLLQREREKVIEMVKTAKDPYMVKTTEDRFIKDLLNKS